MKKVLWISWVFLLLLGCSTEDNSNDEKIRVSEVLENERVVVLVHGLNSGATTWKDMSHPISQALGVESGSSVEVGLSITINKDAKCWDAFQDQGYIACSELSEIKGEELFRKNYLNSNQYKAEADEHIFGLDKGSFTISRINWKGESEPSEAMVYHSEEKREKFLKERLFSINFSNSNQLSYDAQGYQLAEVLRDIESITGVKKFILIGHSMGGLASRACIQNENIDGITKLITLDTPHLGGKSFATLGAGAYPGGKNASVNLAYDSKALKELNDIEHMAGKYEMIEVQHLGYSDGLNGLDILNRGSYYDESDGIVDIASQMGLDALDPYRVIFSPILKGDIKEYKNLLTDEISSADKVLKSEHDYGISTDQLNLSLAHTSILSDDAYLNYILEVLK